MTHLQSILTILQQQSLFAKRSKCKFALHEVNYLGNIISISGVREDLSKLQVMLNWPIPKIVKSLRGFLGIIGYYRKFIKGYGSIAIPLILLLRKNYFLWSKQAEMAFNALKTTITLPPVLRLPDFSSEFTIECDDSGVDLGVFLMQEGQPIAFFKKCLREEPYYFPHMRRNCWL